MTNFSLPWRKQVPYESVCCFDSEAIPGVRFKIRRISLAQRIALTTQTRELTRQNDFLRAGNTENQLDAALADLLVEKLYLEWALAGVEGLKIDGARASVELLIEKGPQLLVEEISAAIRGELALSESERKN